jgi:hypothetical protein
MAIGASAVCNSFKSEVLQALHNFKTAGTGGNTFKLAMYTNAATISATTTAYAAPADPAADPTNTGEISTTGTGYTPAGGKAVTNVTPTVDGTTGITDFSAPISWASATITARGALIYNDTNADRAVMVLNFGGDKTATAGTFTIAFPNPAAATAILQLA